MVSVSCSPVAMSTFAVDAARTSFSGIEADVISSRATSVSSWNHGVVGASDFTQNTPSPAAGVCGLFAASSSVSAPALRSATSSALSCVWALNASMTSKMKSSTMFPHLSAG